LKKRRVLFLDDNLTRCAFAVVFFANDDLYVAHTVKQAIRLLDRYKRFDLVCLDHDLGGNAFAPSDEKSGCEVAKHILKLRAKIPAEIIIHSGNIWGAKRMEDILHDQGIVSRRIPFSQWERWGIK